MKTSPMRHLFFLAGLFVAGTQCLAQGTNEFTWQSRITSNGAPLSGRCDLTFQLYDDSGGGSAASSPLCFDDVDVVEGLVTLQLDFGSNVLDGKPRWMKISVRPGATGQDCSDANDFTELVPLRQLTPAPYAASADKLDGLDSTEFLAQDDFDSDSNGKVDNIALPPISSLSASDGVPAVALLADEDGNVGIGTQDPLTRLDVNGRIRTLSPGILFGHPPMGSIGFDVENGSMSLGVAENVLMVGNYSNITSVGGGTGDRWQSFTAPLTSEVDAVDILMNGSSGTTAEGTILIHAGTGTASPPIATSIETLSSLSGESAWQRVQLDPPFQMTLNQVYTIHLVGDGIGNTAWMYSIGNNYPGGISDGLPSHDYAFRIIRLDDILPAVTVGLGGRVGIGTKVTQNDLGVAGSASIGLEYAESMSAPANSLIIENKLGVGVHNPKGTLDVSGSTAIGVAYAGDVTPPANSLIVQDSVGIGSPTTANRLDVAGSVVIGSAHAGSSIAPQDSLVVQERVGIGTSAPVNRLDVDGAVAIGSSYSGTSTAHPNGLLVQGHASFGTTNNLGTITADAGVAASPALYLDGNSTTGTILTINNNNVGGDDWSLISTGSAMPGGAGNLAFMNALLPHIYFSKGGRAGFMRFPTTNVLEVEGQASKTTAGGFIANSDARIKTDIATVTNAVDTIMKVRPVTFRYTPEYRKEHPSIGDRPYHNIIAQEYAKVFPDYVQKSGEKVPGTEEEILQVDTHALTIVSVAAIQEMEKEIERLRVENREMTARLENKILNQQELLYKLEGRLDELNLSVAGANE